MTTMDVYAIYLRKSRADIEAHSQEDEEYMEFELLMSRREYKMIHKRMDRGRKQAVVEGNLE